MTWDELFEALKVAYLSMEDVTSLTEYTRTIEPLLAGVSDDERSRLGEGLWHEREVSVRWPTDSPYKYSGLAFYLAPLVGGS